MTNSPWSAEDVLRQVRQEVATRVELQPGGMLVLDESAVRKAETKTVGAARIVDLANVPADTRIYLEAPRLEVPETPPGHSGPHLERPRIQTTAPALEARALST